MRDDEIDAALKLASEVRDALVRLMPYVLEDYYETCAMPDFKAAVKAAIEAIEKSK